MLLPPRLGDPQVAFRLLTMVFAQRPGYLTRVCPPTADILAQLEGYDARVMSTLGSLVGPGELESSTSDLARRQAALPLPHGEVGLVRSATSTPRHLQYLLNILDMMRIMIILVAFSIARFHSKYHSENLNMGC